MPESIVYRAGVKAFEHNSSALIKSLLGKSFVCEAYSEEEAIVACFLHLLIGPYQMSQGLSLMIAGAVLAPIPCLVGTVSTNEYVSNDNMTGSISSIGFKTRSPNSPCYLTSKSIVEKQDGSQIITTRKAKMLNFSLGCSSVAETQDPPENQTRTLRRSTQTVTGYSLFTTGIGRVVDGVWGTATSLPVGILKGMYYGGKKAVNACTRNSFPDETAENRATNRV